MILLHEIDSFFIEVSEAISSKHLHDFLHSNLMLKGISLDASSAIFYSYLASCQQYFIAHFPLENEPCFIEPQLLKFYYFEQTKVENQIDLFILENCFVVYENQELLLFKLIQQKVSAEQIQHFIQKSLHLSVDNCIEVHPQQVKIFQQQFEANLDYIKPLSYLKNNHYKELKRFLAVCFACLLTVILALGYEIFFDKKTKQPIVQKSVYPQKALKSVKIADVIERINYYKLQVTTIDFHNELLFLTLKHTQKSHLIEFLTHYQAEVKRLKYNTQERVYELSASFSLL